MLAFDVLQATVTAILRLTATRLVASLKQASLRKQRDYLPNPEGLALMATCFSKRHPKPEIISNVTAQLQSNREFPERLYPFELARQTKTNY
jgi:hypothetical protein